MPLSLNLVEKIVGKQGASRTKRMWQASFYKRRVDEAEAAVRLTLDYLNVSSKGARNLLLLKGLLLHLMLLGVCWVLRPVEQVFVGLFSGAAYSGWWTEGSTNA